MDPWIQKLKGPMERALQWPPDPNQPAYSTTLSGIMLNEPKPSKRNIMINIVSKPTSRWEMWFGYGLIPNPKLSVKWKGPARVKKQLGPVNYAVVFLSDPDKCEMLHVQSLKICHGYHKLILGVCKWTYSVPFRRFSPSPLGGAKLLFRLFMQIDRMKKSACVWERKQWFPHTHISEANGPKIEDLFWGARW